QLMQDGLERYPDLYRRMGAGVAPAATPLNSAAGGAPSAAAGGAAAGAAAAAPAARREPGGTAEVKMY
ncbi:hypothetical protein QN394_28535, partial [Pseudomonas sp. 5S2]|nr:hypothetical protein [Pseudomonas sp. 5S2]